MNVSGSTLVLVARATSDLVDPALVADVQRAGADSLQVNLCDLAVRSAPRVSTTDPPLDAALFVTGRADVARVRDAVAERGEVVGAWWTETTTVVEPPGTPQGQRLDALATVALLRRPAAMDEAHWRHAWQVEHAQVAADCQASLGHVQHRVLEAAAPHSPAVAAVVEEHFAPEAVSDPHAFYGSGGDQAELDRRMTAVVASAQRFGADRDLDLLPTSRYRWTW